MSDFGRLRLLLVEPSALQAKIIRKACDASLEQNVRTPEIQVAGGANYGTNEIGDWIANYIAEN